VTGKIGLFILAVVGFAGSLRADVTLTATPTGGVAAVQAGQSFSVDLTWTGDGAIAAGDATLVFNTNEMKFTGAVFDPTLDFKATNPSPEGFPVVTSEIFCTWYRPAGFLGKTVTLTFQVPANYAGPSVVTVSVQLTGAHDLQGFELTGNSVGTSINIGADSATVSGHLYVDTNGDGDQDPGEPDLPNVRLNITAANNAAKTAVTDGSGYWKAAVVPGLTSISVDKTDTDFSSKVLTGFIQTQGSDPVVATAVSGVDTNTGSSGFFNRVYITAEPLSQTVNPATAVTFTVTAVGEGLLSYQWRKGGSAIGGANTASYTINPVSEASEGSYDVLVTNTSGAVVTSMTSSAATLSVNDPVVITTQPASLTLNAGAPATFSVTATGTGTLTYQWRKGGIAIGGATNPSLALAAVAEADAGSYDVVVTNVVGSVTSSAAVLAVNPAPTSATFAWNGTDSDATKVSWDVAGNWTSTPSTGRFPNAAGDVANATTLAASIFALNQDTTLGEFRSDRSSNRSLALAPGTGSNVALTWDTGNPATDAVFYVRRGGANTKQLRTAITTHRMVLNSNLLVDVAIDRAYGANADRNSTGTNNRIYSDISGAGKLILRASVSNNATTNMFWSLDGVAGNTHGGGTEFQKSPAVITGSISTYRLNTITATGSGDMTVKAGADVLVASVAGAQGAIQNDTRVLLESETTTYGRLALTAGHTETVGLLAFNGVYQAKGTWGATGSGATNINDNYFATALTNVGTGYTGKISVQFSEPANLTTTASGALANGATLSVTNSAGANGDAGKVTARSLTSNAGTFSLSGINLNDSIAVSGGSLSGTIGFNSAGALNGVVPAGTLSLSYDGVGVSNSAKVNGSSTRTLNYTLSAATVSGNTGNGSASIAVGAGIAGLYAVDAAASGTRSTFATRVDFRSGSNSFASPRTIGVQFPSSASNTTGVVSDVATVTGLGGAKFVVQFSYHLASAPNAVFLGYWTGSQWVNAVAGNSAGTPSNLGNQPWNSNFNTLGQYGYDSTTGVAWAVIDYSGDLAVVAPNTAPSLSAIDNQVVLLNTPTAALALTVGDAESLPASLSVTATSSNQSLLPNANIQIGGSGANRTVTATPVTDATGTATITLSVDDGALSATRAFTLTVNASPTQSWWISRFGSSPTTTGPSSLAGDPDGDGLSNLFEYSQGGNPSLADGASVAPTTNLVGDQIIFTYRKAAPELVYRVIQSSNLTSWSTVTSAETSNNDGTFSRSVSKASGSVYLRLEVSTATN
jgi:hypothetical protein